MSRYNDVAQMRIEYVVFLESYRVKHPNYESMTTRKITVAHTTDVRKKARQPKIRVKPRPKIYRNYVQTEHVKFQEK